MSDQIDNDGTPPDDMLQYVQLFLDETEEQLDDLVESLLVLENHPESTNELNEAFRLIHSIKGAAGMMGFNKIMVLTHQLENRFERSRSGQARLDQPTMNLVLKCIDYLRACNARIRSGEQLGSSAELLDELQKLEDQAGSSSPPTAAGKAAAEAAAPPAATQTVPAEPADSTAERPVAAQRRRITITFEPGLALADLKASLVVTRLSELGEIKATRPSRDELAKVEHLSTFELMMDTKSSDARLREAADVDGVRAIEFDDGTSATTLEDARLSPGAVRDESRQMGQDVPAAAVPLAADGSVEESTSPLAEDEPASVEDSESASADMAAKAQVTETMRVDIDRLDNLMNLAGQLVINRARFVQVAEQLRPALRKTNDVHRVRDFGDSLRRTIEGLRNLSTANGEWTAEVRDLETGLELLEQQVQLWDSSRRCISQVNEAIDQLTRVSDSLQRGVMETRMVPVAPLFNRFKRVVRDLSLDRGKRVQLKVRGEKTELDKRMIDQLGDPLMHLVRNCIDHGLERPEVRTQRGKPEAGTISLEASHSGNNIHIQVRDDGGGINVEKIRNRLLQQRILGQAEVDELSDAQVADYIWHPGLSTAAKVTDISGRGVGMDVVNSRISELNGTVEVQSVPEQGTTFTIRLPLTLAIINSLMVRVHNVIFSIPLDDVREIVSIRRDDIVTIHGKQTFDVRGEFVPLVRIDDVFSWHEFDDGDTVGGREQRWAGDDDPAEVVILHTGSRALGLRVAELLGSQDIVIKSLAENLVHIRGLSGASILGDGTVCLMLDVGAVLDMVFSPQEIARRKE